MRSGWSITHFCHSGLREIVHIHRRLVALILMRNSQNAGAATCTPDPNAHLRRAQGYSAPGKVFKQWGILHGIGFVNVDFVSVRRHRVNRISTLNMNA